MPTEILNAILGGGLIGIGVSLLLLTNGRIFGVSGVIGGVLRWSRGDVGWRLAIIGGLVVAGVIALSANPTFLGSSFAPSWRMILGGILVGFGSQLGNGCTSGHGICGVSRFSLRSLSATATFMASGILAVAAIRTFGGIP